MMEILFYFIMFVLVSPFIYCFVLFILACILAYWEFIGKKFMKFIESMED